MQNKNIVYMVRTAHITQIRKGLFFLILTSLCLKHSIDWKLFFIATYLIAHRNYFFLFSALHEMVERATKENVKQILCDVMTEYGINIKQVLSVAHDNGQNMVASVKLLKKMVHPYEEYPFLKAERELLNEFATTHSETSESDEEECEELEPDCIVNEINDDFEGGQQGTAEISAEDDDDEEMFDVDLLDSTRCAVHTAQLAVWDVLKHYKTRMAAINKIGITMRHKLHRQLFTMHKVPLPPKVVETRWNIWYLLNKYFKDLKGHPILEMLKNQDSSIGKHYTYNVSLQFKPSRISFDSIDLELRLPTYTPIADLLM